MEDLGGEAEDVVDEEDGDGGGGGAGGVCGGRRGVSGDLGEGRGEEEDGKRTAFHAIKVYVGPLGFVVFCNDGWYVAAGLLALVVQ